MILKQLVCGACEGSGQHPFSQEDGCVRCGGSGKVDDPTHPRVAKLTLSSDRIKDLIFAEVAMLLQAKDRTPALRALRAHEIHAEYSDALEHIRDVTVTFYEDK